MSPLAKFGASTGVLAFLIAQPATAQQCGPRMQALMPTAISLNSQAHPTSERIGALFGEGMALVGVDEAACLRKLAELEALIRQRQGGGGGGGGGNGQASSPTSTASAPSGNGRTTTAARAPLPTITPPTPFSQRMPSHLEFMPPARRIEMEAMAEFVEAIRDSGIAGVRAAAEVDAVTPPALDGSPSNRAGEIAQGANETIATAEVFQEVLINEPGDVISAAMEDAFREFDEAQKALRDLLDSPASPTDPLLAPLISSDHPAYERLKAARQRLQAVRLRQLKWILEERDGGMRPGFAAAFDEMEARQRREMKVADDNCQRIADEAQVRNARDFLNGNRRGTALEEAQAQCDSLTVHVRERHQVEFENLMDRYRITADELESELRRPRATRSGSAGGATGGGGRAGGGGGSGAAPTAAEQGEYDARLRHLTQNIEEAAEELEYLKDEKRAGEEGIAEQIADAEAQLEKARNALAAERNKTPAQSNAEAAWPRRARVLEDDARAAVRTVREHQAQNPAGDTDPAVNRRLAEARANERARLEDLDRFLRSERGAAGQEREWLADARASSERVQTAYSEVDRLTEAKRNGHNDSRLDEQMNDFHGELDRWANDLLNHMSRRPTVLPAPRP